MNESREHGLVLVRFKREVELGDMGNKPGAGDPVDRGEGLGGNVMDLLPAVEGDEFGKAVPAVPCCAGSETITGVEPGKDLGEGTRGRTVRLVTYDVPEDPGNLVCTAVQAVDDTHGDEIAHFFMSVADETDVPILDVDELLYAVFPLVEQDLCGNDDQSSLLSCGHESTRDHRLAATCGDTDAGEPTGQGVL